MSSTIEERVIAMKFQGEEFLTGVDKSLKKLSEFTGALKLAEGTKGLDNVGAAAGRQSGSLSKLADGVQHISDRFKAMGVVALATLSTITSQAVYAGENLVKSLTIAPVIDGFHEYETNLNSIQTILANTQAAGTKLKDVTDALNELNHYSDQTIYNFASMAKNIGTFTAAGVALKPATQAIKGIANLAALSGSSAEDASGAMYQLSQAISSGRVSMEDWISVRNAGMGGSVFQRALAETAVAMGVINKSALKLEGPMKNVSIHGQSFADSIRATGNKKSWLTSDVLTKTLAQFTGDLTKAQLKAQGFNDTQIKAIQAQAKMAQNAATQVKTLTQLLGTIKEAVGSGWAQTWQSIFGDFPEAKTLFTSVNNVIGGFVTASANARNKVLADWKALGGRTFLIDAIGNSFKALVAFVKPIREAFREIFPATTGKQLAEWSKSIRDFTANLTISGTTAANLKSTFKGFFALLDIGWTIIKELVGTIADLLGVATKGSGGILAFTGHIGDWIVKVRDAIKAGTGLHKFFEGLGKVLAVPINLIKTVIGFIASLVSKVPSINSALSPVQKIGALASMAWDKVAHAVTVVWAKMAGFRKWVSNFFGEVGKDVANLVKGLNFQDILSGISTGLFASLLLTLRKLIGGGGSGLGGVVKSISEGFETLTGSLKAMQNTLRAATLLEIALAVGVLAIAMNTLAKIDAGGLTRASAAITVMFAQLLGSMTLFEKASGFSGAAKLALIAPALILLAAAVDILASAVKKLAALNWNELAKGLTGLTVILGVLVVTMKFMPNPAGLISTAAGLVVLAAAVQILVSAVTQLAGLSWEELGKGLLGVGAILASLTLFTKFSEADKGGVLQGAGLLLLAVAIKILASAVTQLASLSWGEIARGLVTMAGAMDIMVAALTIIPPTAPLAALGVLGVAISMGMIADALGKLGGMSWGEIGKGLVAMLGAMTIIALALTVIPPTAILGAAGVLVVAISLGMIGDALAKFAELSWGDIGKAMVVLARSLTIITIAMAAMEAALPGAAALLVVAASLAILTPVLIALGGMSWGDILKGLVALAGALAVIGVAGLLLTPVIPSLLGLGAAIALLGVGMALAGAGVFLFATGLTLLAASGVAAAGALVGMVTILLGALPTIVKLVGALLIALLDLIIQAAPKIGQAMVVIMSTLLDTIVKISPKIVDTMFTLLDKLLGALVKYLPKLQQKGLDLVVALLNGVARNIGRVVTAATNVIIAFLNALGRNVPRIQDAGVKMITSFVNGLAAAVRNNTAAMQKAGLNLAMAIIDGMTGGLGSGVGRIVDKAKEVAQSALSAAKNVLGIHSPSKEFEKIGRYVNDGFRKGLDGNKGQVDSSFKSLRDQLSAGMRSATDDVTRLQDRLARLHKARKKDATAIRETTVALAQARKERDATSRTLSYVNKNYSDEQITLGKLANSYDALSEKLKTAQDTLANAIKTRDDYNQSVKDQYDNLPNTGADVKLTDYISTLQKQVDDTRSFVNAVQRLRSLGLNDQSYKELIGTGTSALPFVNELLASGKTSVDQINSLASQLETVSSSLGSTASSQLYQAAVDSAAGIVKGLQNQQAAIEAQMDKIADAMVSSIKKKLGIKSPSRVFAELGGYAAQGLSQGLQSNSAMVTNTTTAIGERAIEALRVSLSDVDKMVLGNIDVQPTIRPVLDLTDIRKNAGKIGSLLPSGTKMTVDASSARASAVASVVNDQVDGGGAVGSSGSGGNINYVQNNYSPKAISPVEIYRGTKNQLSTVKGALSNK